MPSCQLVKTTPAIQAKAQKLALLLPSSDVEQIQNDDPRMQWFKYTRGQPCHEDFQNIIEGLKDIVCTWLRLV
jgi:hypothetical protein